MTGPLVVDASVLLAVALDEPGGREAEPRLPGSAISVVNLAEVCSYLIQRGLDPGALETVIGRLSLDAVPADFSQAMTAARLHAATRALGLSLADCFCLGLAQARGAEVLTADRTWSRLRLGLAITIIR
jgi:PIN domain nuclease of toxin-antitoxin system